MNIYNIGLLMIAGILVFLVFYCIHNRKAQKSEIKKLSKEKLRMEQNQKNFDFVFEIINGTPHYSRVTKEASMDVYAKWQERENKLFDEKMTPEKTILRNKVIEENESYHPYIYSDLKPGSKLTVNDELIENEGYIFLEDAFTEPFPSTHDLDDLPMMNKFTDIMIAYGFNKAEAKNFYFHKKQHFVNPDMTHAIICFDLYRLKN